MSNRDRSIFSNNSIVTGIIVTSLIYLFATLVPAIGPVFLVVTPLPLIYFYLRLGRLRGWSVFLGTMSLILLAAVITSDPAILVAILFFGLAGIAIGETTKRDLSIEATMLITVAIVLLPVTLFVLYESFRTAQSPW
ncbi:MAG: DUF2232 domain-containing protein, partial [Smithellaceae bacterium]|nr:DUF2232 domain-containing protein [Smithellaceae bacterium]